MKRSVAAGVVLFALPGFVLASSNRLEFTRMVAHWAEYADTGYVQFVEDANVEIAQVGFYGAHFWSLAHTPFGSGYPAHFPTQGLAQCGGWFQNLNAELHRRSVRVIGHFNVEFLVGDPDSPEGPRGFFKFYRDLWDPAELGPKPVADPLELLEKQADGKPITNNNYSIGGMREYWGCLNNPHWRGVLKAWVKRGIERGVDGYMINYFYRHNCLCPYCVAAFKKYMSEHFTPEDLAKNFGITNLEQHVFPEIVSWHPPAESTPLRREMLRFSQIANKAAFDEVFITYGRSLKPDLIVGQWNHLGNFGQLSGDERCLLPAELWGRGEDYLWYSTGDAGHYTDLAEHYLGEGTLQARYILGAFDDKPFTLGKYESTRTRVSIAELIANGGAPMGFYTSFKDPMAREEIVRYYGFIKKHEDLFKANRPYAETVLVYPRGRVHEGDIEAVKAFWNLGTQLLDKHVLFDVVPDDMLMAGGTSGYRRVFLYTDTVTNDVLTGLSTFDVPWTVRVSGSRPAQGKDIVLHFVNYNREEPAEKHSAGGGIKDEKPIAVAPFAVEFVIPSGMRVKRLQFMSPETPDPVKVKWRMRDGRLCFQVPGFLVYGVVRVGMK